MADTGVEDGMLADESMYLSTPVLAANRAIWTKFSDESLIYGHATTPDEGRDWIDLGEPSFFNDALDATLNTPRFSPPAVENDSITTANQAYPSAASREEAVKTLDDEYSKQTSSQSNRIPPISSSIVVELPQSTLNNPRSVYDGFEPGMPITDEREAVTILLDALKQRPSQQDDFIEFDLIDFTVYVDSRIYPNEMRPLQHLATRVASGKFYFDGTLQVGGKKLFVKKVPFRELPIGNYCDVKEHSVGDQIWLRSELNQNREIYYKLVSPSTEYERFWIPFRWIADLSKHVVDYSLYLQKRKERARLRHFQYEFSAYITKQHHRSAAFRRWSTAHGSADFRNALVANIDFIWKEAVGLPAPDNKIATCHDFWSEVKGTYYTPMTSALPMNVDEDSSTPEEISGHKQKGKADQPIAKTIVTPYIFDLFSHMGFDNIFESTAPSDSVRADQLQQIEETESTQAILYQGVNEPKGRKDFLAGIQAGDVISTPPDADETGTKWKREISKHHESDYVWYGMVQKVHETTRGLRSFDVIWMYQARDTPCALMKYPWPNELFLSDTCTCGPGLDRVEDRDVLGTHRVAWFGNPTHTRANDFFVRQTYLAEERCWVALAEDHLRCNHHSKVRHRSVQRRYQQGHTVLVKLPKSNRLDVFVIERLYKEQGKRWARLRKLLRRNDIDGVGNYPANELIYTERFIEVDSKRIVRHCLVEAFDWQDEITSPYNRGGTGDAFYLTHQEITVLEEPIVPIGDLTTLHFRRGFRPTPDIQTPRLRGLDLYCGGGNFGRGIEDGGGVEMRWANDISTNAMHSYMANCDPDACRPFLGSVDDLFRWILNGHPDAPRPGEVQFISGGSPCQGFSRLTKTTLQKTLKQWKNRSLVASFASFIDLFRPQYGLLENVVSMIKAQEKRQECFFSQLVCAIVGLGYQVRIVYADAWSYGAPQSRCRVFLSFAAPGVQLPKAPEPTHSHPPGINMGSLGKMSNGQPFGKRAHVATQFKFTSASEAVGDLPDIIDGKADYCVGFPSHRISVGFTSRTREQLRHIPTQPYNLGFSKARFGYEENGKRVLGTITDADRDHIFPSAKELRTQPGTQGWTRVHPHGLFRTVVTACGPTDRLTGCVNHWHQSRPLSVLEVRRAQGFLDYEVITGKPSQQWHIVGNSVSRHVALALGLAIREAWFGTLFQEGLLEDIEVDLENDLTEVVVEDPPTRAQLSEQGPQDLQGDFFDHVDDFLSDLFVDPISTPATSLSDSQDERTNLKKKLLQKRRTSQLDMVNLSTKRIRWGSTLTDELSGTPNS